VLMNWMGRRVRSTSGFFFKTGGSARTHPRGPGGGVLRDRGVKIIFLQEKGPITDRHPSTQSHITFLCCFVFVFTYFFVFLCLCLCLCFVFVFFFERGHEGAKTFCGLKKKHPMTADQKGQPTDLTLNRAAKSLPCQLPFDV